MLSNGDLFLKDHYACCLGHGFLRGKKKEAERQEDQHRDHLKVDAGFDWDGDSGDK